MLFDELAQQALMRAPRAGIEDVRGTAAEPRGDRMSRFGREATSTGGVARAKHTECPTRTMPGGSYAANELSVESAVLASNS